MEMVKQTAGRDSLGDFAPEFARLNDDVLFGEEWSREDRLSPRDRSVVTVVALMSKGILDSSLKYHIENARRNGVTAEEMAEIITHAAFYAGWPNAWGAMRYAKEAYAEDVGKPEPPFTGADLKFYLDSVKPGTVIRQGTRLCDVMNAISTDTGRLCAELNDGYRTMDERRRMFSGIVGSGVDPGFRVFTPFYSDFGKNIHLGNNVFINCGCNFQDQGGIYIGDNALIGHGVTLATLDHDQRPDRRGDMICRPITLGKNVWLGAGATVVGGVTIGDNSIIGAGAVVTKDVPADSVAVGVPAKVVRHL